MLSPPDRDVVRRDDSLPGLATVLDPAAMVAALRRARPEFHCGDTQINYVRYKPETSCLVGFRAILDGKDVLFTAQARRANQSDKIAKAVGKSGVPGLLGPGRFMLPELALIVSVFPNDRRLAHLKRLADPGKVRKLVRELAGDHPPARETRLELLHYRPERRCVSRLVGNAGPLALVKFHDRQAFERASSNARAFASRDSLHIPRHIGLSRNWRAVAVEWIRGEVTEPTPAYAARIGTALALLHAQPVTMVQSLTPEGQARALRSLARDLSRLWPPLGARCRQAARQLGAALIAESSARRPIHGDFHADQVVMAGDRIGLIDFDEAALGSPAWDLGNFIGHLHYRSLGEHEADPSTPLIAEGLIDGYRSGGGEVSWREVELQTAAALMRLMTRPFRERDPSWPEKTERIVERVEQLLGQTLPGSAVVSQPSRIDSALPLLEQALDPRTAMQHIAQAAPATERWSIGKARLVRHKPGRRCLIEYRLATEPGETILLGKMRARGADRRAFALQRDLWTSGFGPTAEDRVMVAEPIAVVPDLGLWLQRKCPGVALTDLLDGATIPEASRIAQAITKLHRSPILVSRRHGMTDEMRILKDRLSDLAEQQPHLARRIDSALENALIISRRAVPTDECGIHRDFYPDHVLVDGSDLYILDLDLHCAGDAAVDIGNFLAHIVEHGVRLRGSADFLAGWRAEFAAACCRLAPVSPVNIRIYELLSLLRLAEISTRIAGRERFTGILLEHCEQQLQRAAATEEND